MREALVDPATYATTLLVLFVDRYGTESLAWHPETIKMELEQDFNVSLPRPALDKLMTAITLVTTDFFYKSLPRFTGMCEVLAGGGFDPSTASVPDAYECAWAMTEAMMIHPPEEGDPDPFEDEIRWYLGQVLKEGGFITPPDILRVALGGDYASQVAYSFADDPEMFSAMNKTQADKTVEVEDMLRENLRELVGQVQALPLANGTVDQLLKRLPADVLHQDA